MIKRAVFARELGVPIVMHDYLTGGFKKKKKSTTKLRVAPTIMPHELVQTTEIIS